MPRSPERPILLGAHMSIAGGVHTAVERGISIGCTTMQMFVKNNNRWRGKELTDEDISTYKKLLQESSIGPVVVHDTYLINLCATDKQILRKSRAALKDELTSTIQNGSSGLVLIGMNTSGKVQSERPGFGC